MPSDKTRIYSQNTQPGSIRTTTDNRYSVGDIIKGRFKLISLLGVGGMGSVYKAVDLIQEEAQEKHPWVAIKIMNTSALNSEEALMCLQRETRKSRSLSHPNIVTVYDFDRDENCVFMTMEYLEGTTLEQWISDHPIPGYQVCKPIWLKIASALEYAHNKGLVHCDFKPNNVFICNDGEVKVIDFGIARANADVKNRSTTTRFDVGKLGALTPAYASCEMIEALQPVAKDDIFSFAIVIYEMLTGNHPFNGLMATQARAKGMKAPTIKDINTEEWKRLKTGLSFSRDKRPLKASELIVYENNRHSHVFTVIKAVSFTSVIFMLFASLSYYFLNSKQFANDNVEDEVSIETVINEIEGSSIIEDDSLSILSKANLEEIELLLAIADAHLGMKRIVNPPGSNAFEAYQKVLVIDPNNGQAKAGLNKIAHMYYMQAKEYIRLKDLERTHVAIQQGLKISPAHAGLQSLQIELEILFNE